MAAVQTLGATDPKATKKKDPEPPDGTKPILCTFIASTSRVFRMTNSGAINTGQSVSNSGSISGIVSAIHLLPPGLQYRVSIVDSRNGAMRYEMVSADQVEGEVSK